MTIHPRAIALMHQSEGCRLRAYMPTKEDKPTIGWGMTFYPDGRAVRMGDVITQAQADAMFTVIANRFADQIRPMVGEATPQQFGAMVCLAYNIGVGAFARSSVLRLHKAGDWKGAARAFGLWDKQAGKVLPGLVRRRAMEAAMYLSAA